MTCQPSCWRETTALLIGGILFLVGLNWRDITTSHEARVAQTARQMAAAGWPWDAQQIQIPPLGPGSKAEPVAPRWGEPPIRVNPWVAPVLNGQIRLQKPPLPYWCTALVDRLTRVKAAAGRWTPALFGLVSAALMADLARRLLGGSGWIAASVWVSSQFVVGEFRKSMADPFLAFFTLLTFWAWVRATQARRAEPQNHRHVASWMLLTYATLGLGVLAKGPFIFLHAGVAILAYRAGYGAVRVGRWWMHLLGVLVFLALALPWPLHVLNTVPGAGELWMHEVFSGVGGEVDNPRPWFMYLGSLFLITLPWTPLWLAGIVQAVSGADRRGRFLLLWTALVVATMSISSQKKDAYLLPLMPAQVLLTTIAIRNLSKDVSPATAWRFAQWVVGILVIVGYSIYWREGAARQGFVIAAVAGGIAACSVIWLRQVDKWLTVQTIAYAVWIFALLNFIETPRENLRSARRFAKAASLFLTPEANVLVPNIPAEGAFYLPLDLHYDPSATHVLAITKGSSRSETPERLVKFFNEGSRVPGARVSAAEQLVLPDAVSSRSEIWHVVRLTLAPPVHGGANLTSEPAQTRPIEER